MQVQNSYTPINFEGKVKFKRASLFDRTKLCSFEVDHENLGPLKIQSEKTKKGRYAIRIHTKNYFGVANESFCMTNNDIYGVSVRTSEPHRGQHLGEISSLATIITMLKNGIKEINLFSLDSAILFHSKYKFEPNITEARPAVVILKQMQCSKIKEFKVRAQEILTNFKKNKNKEELCMATNKLMAEYIAETQADAKSIPNFYRYMGVDMQLTRENVIKNKDFFNALFEKHDIDYKI